MSPECPGFAYTDSTYRKGSIRIDGEFELVRGLNHSPPALGRVSRAFKATDRRGGDANFRRLQVLLPPRRFGWPVEEPGPVVVIAVGERDAGDILDYEFLGPILQEDVDDVGEVVRFIVKGEFDNTDRSAAERLLSSENPWMVFLGLVRLRDIEKLDAGDFFVALGHLPTRHTAQAVRQLVWHGARFRSVRETLADALIRYLGDAAPEHQLEPLRALCAVLERGGFGAHKWLSPRRAFLVARLDELARTRSEEEGWGEVVEQYERLRRLLAGQETEQ